MPQLTRTDKKPYKSTCSEQYVDAPNYIAELICQNYAEKHDLGKLPQYFWRMPKFKNRYIREVSGARLLLKDFDAGAIIAALQTYRGKWFESLRSKKLRPLIEEQQKRVKKTEFVPTEEREVKDSVGRPKFGKKNPLRDL